MLVLDMCVCRKQADESSLLSISPLYNAFLNFFVDLLFCHTTFMHRLIFGIIT